MIKSCVVLRNVLLALFCLVFSARGAAAKSARIQQPIDESSRVALQGNARPLPKGAADLGPANASLPSGRMLLVLKRSAAEESELQQLLSGLQDKNSANYHKWLTPAQYAERFGVAAADAQTLTSWLQSHGFTVNKVSAGRTSIEFSGTVGQVQSAFHTSIHRYAVGGVEHLANSSDPAIPAALAPVVSGIVGLNDFFPKAAPIAAAHALYDKQTHTAKPEFTTSAGGNLLYVGPADAATIYDTPNSYNANFKSGQSYLGNNITIAVVGDANINPSDVANYRSFFGLPANPPQVIIDGNDPGVDANTTGDTQKALRDVEIAGALAPKANVILYTAADTATVSGLFLALSRAVDDNLADVIEFGFSSCETDLGSSGNHFVMEEWEQAAVDGVTVVVAAGDSGSAGCDLAANDTSATGGLAVNGYASTPYNVAVGGTDFDGLPGKFSSYVGSNGTALGYIPELPWNNSTAVNGAYTANTPYMDANGFTNDFAGGGGASGTYGKPNWQTGSNLKIPTDHARDLPDVSLLAGTAQYGATWAVCGNDYDTSGNPIADCAGSPATVQGLGGTSAAASAFAGILALVAQSQGGRLGQANYVLYNLANQASLYGSVFHDVATGNNSVVCAAGGTNCGTNNFLTGYNAGTGYDQASGLGSVDASQLIADWGKAANSLLPTTTTLTVTLANGEPLPAMVQHGTPITIGITVAGNGGTPTGNVGVADTVDGPNNDNTYGDNAAFSGALNNGSFTTTLDNEPGGTYNNVAFYGGDLNFAASASSPVMFTVTPEPSEIYMSLYYRDSSGTHQSSGANPSFPYGTYVAVDAEPQRVAPLPFVGVATGTVTFTDNSQPVVNASGQPVTTAANNLNRQGFAEIPNYYWAFGSHAIRASYSGDNSFSFNPSVSGSPGLSFTITQSPTTVTVSPVPSSVISGTVAVMVTVAGTAGTGGAPPSGTVTLVDTTNGVSFGPGTLASGSYTFTIPASQLALVGASTPNTLTATYNGANPTDPNYASGSTGTGTVTRLAQVQTALTITASPVSLATGSTTITGQITPVSSAAGTAPTGSVTLVDSTNGALLGTVSLVAGTQNGLPIATFTLAVNATSLTLGQNTITATYLGDPNYSGSSGSVVVTLLQPTFTISATNVAIATPGETTGNTSAITVTPVEGFTGQVNLTTAFVSGPTGAISPPTVTLSASSATIAGTTPGTATATIATTALTYAMQRPADKIPGRWYEGGGITLAGLLLLGIPARRRGWPAMLGLLLFVGVGLGLGCGVHLNAVKTEPTSAGSYVFSVTGVDQATGLITAKTTFTVTVQ
jgi:hypothetical protein